MFAVPSAFWVAISTTGVPKYRTDGSMVIWLSAELDLLDTAISNDEKHPLVSLKIAPMLRQQPKYRNVKSRLTGSFYAAEI
jgi:hypothetical protein